MPLFRAIGFGLLLIILKVMMPEVFNGLEDTLIKFFHVMGASLDYAPHFLDQTASVYPHAVTP